MFRRNTTMKSPDIAGKPNDRLSQRERLAYKVLHALGLAWAALGFLWFFVLAWSESTYALAIVFCIDPAVSAQARLLKHKPQQGFAYRGLGEAAGGYKSQSSHR